MAYSAQMLRGQLSQAYAMAPAAQALQGHSLQQVPAPKTGSTAAGVQILATAATAPRAAPLLGASAAGPSEVQQADELYTPALACARA